MSIHWVISVPNTGKYRPEITPYLDTIHAVRVMEISDQQDDDIGGNDELEERELKKSSLPFPPVMRNFDGPNIFLSEVVNIAPGEG